MDFPRVVGGVRIPPYLTVHYLKLLLSGLSACAAELDYRNSIILISERSVAGRVGCVGVNEGIVMGVKGNRFPELGCLIVRGAIARLRGV